MNKQVTNENKVNNEEIKKLVIARLDTIPSDVSISVGSDGSYNKKQLIEQIEMDTEIGRKMVEIDIEYLRRLKEGILNAPSISNY